MPPLVFNGVTIPENSANALSFNGSDVTQVVFNGTTVWQQSLGPSYSLGLSSVLHTVSGENAQWSIHSVDISAYAGATVRPVFHYVSGSSFTGDLQLDQITLNGSTAGFEGGVDSFEGNNAVSYASYGSVVWQPVTTATSGNGLWLRDRSGTSSSNTGLTNAGFGSFYLYAETSGAGAPSKNFWLRGPQTTLGSSPSFTYMEARSGATIGTLNVHLDVIS